MKTYSARAGEIQRNWWLVNADGLTLGRLSTKLAMLLQGKNKPVYTPHIDTGDFVVVVNADKLHVSGNKLEQKHYYRHTGYPGGQKSVLMRDLLANHPDRVLRHAVAGMMPKNRLGRAQIKKLKIYSGIEHPHEAQQPQVLEF
ncbi:MAG: 50S ribosomal protein L13 [Candidatus Fermentibacteraceae bacterium]